MADENKIGEVIPYQGEKYKVVEACQRRSLGNRFISVYFPCMGCAFQKCLGKHKHGLLNICRIDNFVFGPCDAKERKDKKDIIFQKIVSEK